MLKLPTLDDVAHAAGVSTATVSRCLNAPDMVRAPTRERVLRAVAELGYTPHFGGRALASNRTNTIGVVIPTMESAIFARGLQALQEALSDSGVTLLIATSHYDPAREAAQIRALLGRGVDGLILIGNARPPETYALLDAHGIPFVLMWSHQADCPRPSVGFDNRAAARAMAEKVLDMDHSRVAMIAGVTAWNDRAQGRVEGVRAALQARGLSLEPPLLIEAPYLLDDSTKATHALLALSPRPTAIICGNDVQAAGALRAAREAGLSAPKDLSVVGFDDIELAIAVDPPLTTVHVPHRRMGDDAARMLLALIAGHKPPGNIVFETEIIMRGSLGPPPT
ncbi:MAG: LacI family transcriptional regulator [Paracoccaceae bacterium]